MRGKTIAIIGIAIALGVLLYLLAQNRSSSKAGSEAGIVVAPPNPKPKPKPPVAPVPIQPVGYSSAKHTGVKFSPFENRRTPPESYQAAHAQAKTAQSIDAKTFETIILNEKQSAIVAFTSQGCGHCQQMKPNFQQAAKMAKLPFFIVDVSDAGPLVQKYDIGSRGVPSIFRFEQGELANVYTGNRSAQDFVRFAS